MKLEPENNMPHYYAAKGTLASLHTAFINDRNIRVDGGTVDYV